MGSPNSQEEQAMTADSKRNLRDVLVFVVADGHVAEEEKGFVRSLRDRLGIDQEEFGQLCEEVRDGHKQLTMPRDPELAKETLCLLVEAAVADKDVSQVEHRLLYRVADHIGIKPGTLDAMIARAMGYPEFGDAEMEAGIEEIYQNFAAWDEATRRAKLTALADQSRLRMKALVQMLECYRSPDGMEDPLDMKVLLVEQFKRLQDSRPVYYLAQHVSIGDADDAVTNFPFRAAAAEGIGKIIGQEFPRDQAGIDAVREWWRGEGNQKYDYLVY